MFISTCIVCFFQLRRKVADASDAQQKAEHEREQAEMKVLEVS